MKYLPVFCIFLLISCFNNSENHRELIIDDLPFHQVENAKEYADLILRSIRTNRDRPIAQELQLADVNFDVEKLNNLIAVYSSGIGGRSDWQYYDVFEFNESEDQSRGFDYVWMDPQGRTGIQIFILPQHKGNQFVLKKLEFRSRLEAMESWAFPGGEIDSYKKLSFNW